MFRKRILNSHVRVLTPDGANLLAVTRIVKKVCFIVDFLVARFTFNKKAIAMAMSKNSTIVIFMDFFGTIFGLI